VTVSKIRSLSVVQITDAIAPGYSSEIKVPMDLTKMQRKLDAHQYSSLKQFDSDVQLMVRNCRKYNGAGSPFTKVKGPVLCFSFTFILLSISFFL